MMRYRVIRSLCRGLGYLATLEDLCLSLSLFRSTVRSWDHFPYDYPAEKESSERAPVDTFFNLSSSTNHPCNHLLITFGLSIDPIIVVSLSASASWWASVPIRSKYWWNQFFKTLRFGFGNLSLNLHSNAFCNVIARKAVIVLVRRTAGHHRPARAPLSSSILPMIMCSFSLGALHLPEILFPSSS